jgi:hypothetical protein
MDATTSLDVQAPAGGTRRKLFLDGGRLITKTLEGSGRPMVIARLCGTTEHLWGPSTVRKQNLGQLTIVFTRALATCSPSTSVIPDPQRGGTDLVRGVRWLAQRPDDAILVLMTDGIHQPPAAGGQVRHEELYRELDQVKSRLRDRLWILGVDEAVRDPIGARVPRTWGLLDFMEGIMQLVKIIQGRR